MIDYEEGRISVRLSEGTFYTLQKDAEKSERIQKSPRFSRQASRGTVAEEHGLLLKIRRGEKVR